MMVYFIFYSFHQLNDCEPLINRIARIHYKQMTAARADNLSFYLFIYPVFPSCIWGVGATPINGDYNHLIEDDE